MFRSLLGWTFLAGVLRKIVRIVNGRKEQSFGERLEESARRLVGDTERGSWDSSNDEGVKREIALTLNHIDRQKALNDHLLANLEREELYFRTKLAQLWPGREEHVSYLWREQDKFKLREKERWQDKLLELEHERRKLAVSLEEKVQPLEARLLALLRQDAQLQQEGFGEKNGHRENSEKA